MKPLKTYVIVLEAAGAVTAGTYEAEMIEEVMLFLSEEYPTYNILNITEVPTRKL